MSESGKTEDITLEWALERIKGLEQRLVGSEEVRRIAVRELGKEKQENKRLKRDATTGVELEAAVCRYTHFSGNPPYVGDAGLVLAIEEMSSKLEAAEQENARLRYIAWWARNVCDFARDESPSWKQELNPYLRTSIDALEDALKENK